MNMCKRWRVGDDGICGESSAGYRAGLVAGEPAALYHLKFKGGCVPKEITKTTKLAYLREHFPLLSNVAIGK